MQAKIKTQPFEFFDPVYDGVFEAPIDIAYDLPDYCPDIQKIFKCRVVPEISSCDAGEEEIICGGVCDIRVLYLDQKGDCVRCCDFTQEFSASAKIKAGSGKAVLRCEAFVEHLSCRAVSARRLDLHFAVSLKALAVVQREEQIACDIDDGSIEKLISVRQATQAVNAISHQFSLEEDIGLKNGKPPIENILRRSVSCRISQCRASGGAVNISGSADISFLYSSALDTAETEKMSFSLDFNENVECPGADDDVLCSVWASAGESSLHPKEDDIGEYTAVSVGTKIFLFILLYRPCELQLIDDAYSADFELELKYAQQALTLISGESNESIKKKLSLPAEEIEKVIDIWCEQGSVQAAAEKGKLNYHVRFNACMLYKGSQGRLAYIEKPFDFSSSADLNEPMPKKSDSSLRLELWDYRITGRSTVDFSVEADIRSLLYGKSSVRRIADYSAAESSLKSRKPSISVYFAMKGERLWDIAKGHRALLSDMRAQNELYEDSVPEDRTIIIRSR